MLPYGIKDEMIENLKHKLFQLYGWTGSVAVITAYGFVTFDYEKNIWIDILNLYGSFSIGLICFKGKIWQAMILEIAWFSVAIYSLINNLTNN